MNIIIRLCIDLVMTALILVAMAYEITGNAIHEMIGILLFALFIVHNSINRRWYKTIFKRKYNMRRTLSITVNLLFLISMTVVMISSIPTSMDVFPFISSSNDMIWRQIHVLTSYWGFILMAIHIGLSWGMILNAVRNMVGITDTSRSRTIVLRVLAVIIVVYGVQTSMERDIGYKLAIYNPFDWGFQGSTIRFLIDYLSIMGIYISGTHYTLKFIQKQKKFYAYKK